MIDDTDNKTRAAGPCGATKEPNAASRAVTGPCFIDGDQPRATYKGPTMCLPLSVVAWETGDADGVTVLSRTLLT